MIPSRSSLHDGYDRAKMLRDEPLVKRPEPASPKGCAPLDPEALVSLRVDSEFEKLRTGQGKQVVPVMLTVRTEDKQLSLPRAGVDLVVVVDDSGSMSGQKITLVKDTLSFIVEQMSETDRVALVKFNSCSRILSGLVPATAANKLLLKAIIQGQISASGGTKILTGLRDGLDILLERAQVNSQTSVCLLSDGQDDMGKNLTEFRIFLNKYDDLMSKKKMSYRLNSFGYGSDHDEETLSLLSNHHNGNFYYINDVKRVDECFIELVGFLLSVFAVGCEINVYLRKGVKMVQTFGLEWQSDASKDKAVLKIGALAVGTEKNYMALVELEPAAPEERVLMAEMTFRCRDEEFTKYKELTMATSADEPGLRNQKVTDNMLRVRAAEELKKIEQAVQSGKVQEAKAMVQIFVEKQVEVPIISETYKAKMRGLLNHEVVDSAKHNKQLHRGLVAQQAMPGLEELGQLNCVQREMLQKRK